MRVNLIEKQKSVFTINWLRVIVTIVIATAIMAIIFNYFVMKRNIADLKIDISIIEDQITMYKSKKQEYYSLEKKIEKLREKPKINIPKYNWEKPIKQLGFIIPSRAMLNSVIIDNNKIMFKGKTYKAEVLRELKNNLVSSPLFKSVDLYKMVKQKEIIFEIDAVLAEGVD